MSLKMLLVILKAPFLLQQDKAVHEDFQAISWR